MKKMLAILMALLMAALLLPAYAEEGDVAEIAEIAGTVLEIGEESILLETPEGQLIHANLTADTIREGKEVTDEEYLVKWLAEGEQWVPERDIEVHIERMTLHFNN